MNYLYFRIINIDINKVLWYYNTNKEIIIIYYKKGE